MATIGTGSRGVNARRRFDAALAALLLLFALLYLLPIGFRPLGSPDEVRYGSIAREMLASGDWLVPHLNGVRYFEKPVLGYWLNAASLGLFGENAFALRLPSALAAGLTALVVFRLARQFANRRAAVLGAVIYLSTFLVASVGTIALIDTFFALFLAIALAAYYRSIWATERRERTLQLLTCGAGCAAALLTKGFVALAIPAIIAAPYLIITGKWRTQLVHAWLPVLVTAALAAPWMILIARREPDFWHYFFWVEHVKRYFATDAQHAQPFWYYLALLPLAGLPWIWMLPAAWQGLRSSHHARALPAYLACWFIAPLLFLSLSHGKLITYLLPCFPALALLLAIGLADGFAAAPLRWWRGGAIALALVWGVLLLALLAIQAGAFGLVAYAHGEWGRLLLMVCCLAAAGVGAAFASRLPAPDARGMALLAMGALPLLGLQFALPRSLLDAYAPSIKPVDPRMRLPGSIIVTDASTFGVADWYLKRSDLYVLQPGEIAYGLGYPDARRRDLSNTSLAAFIEQQRASHDIFVVCNARSHPATCDRMPADAERVVGNGLLQWSLVHAGSADAEG